MHAKKNTIAETPLMKQYNAIKSKYPDALLLFRVGDFYETFGEDAKKAAKILDIVLTKRANGSASYIDLAGFPYHALDTYLPKLVRAGHRVAICDQLEDPKLTKKIVKRGVTELVTPGVSYNDNVLEKKSNNFLAAIDLQDKISGISFLDISTGEFFVAEGKNDYIDKLIQGFKPSEIILQKNKKQEFEAFFGKDYYINYFEDWVFSNDFAIDLLNKQFGTVSLKGFGIEEMQRGVIAAGAALHYLAETHHDKIGHICSISRIEQEKYVWLDKFTIRNLELLHSPNESGISLLQVIDNTLTPMGSRLLKRWIVLPLKEKNAIIQRHESVSTLMEETKLRNLLEKKLPDVGDLERLASKIAIGKINPREFLHISKALQLLEDIKKSLEQADNASLKNFTDRINLCEHIREKIKKTIKEDAPALLSKGNLIAENISEELDEFRKIAFSGKDYIAQIQKRESEKTGIPSLKIGYNNVFGYYLEVTNTHKNKVPEDWHRKQTLTNAERYITEELKEYEEKVIKAEERIHQLEIEIYQNLLLEASSFVVQIQENAIVSGQLDCLLNFSLIAKRNKYVRPEIDNSLIIDIQKGRHPVIEQQLGHDEDYVPNDVYLDNQQQQLLMITGPNMSGKSAFLRQTALICLLAQIGSYVPAKAARIGVVDKIFSRVGASDNISSGESTFMVEMNETASILNNLSERSLILMDEIGRGTSTYDGISIAWAICEYLHEHPLYKAKTLFATHYHELNEMNALFPRIKNFHVSVKEIDNQVIFLRKLVSGGTAHSFGIHVAKMAGIPSLIIDRSKVILRQLEEAHSKKELSNSKKIVEQDIQLSFIQLDDPVIEQIKEDILNTDINTLTPVEALMKLNEIKKILSGK
jgi:DNA mismatch repair protein MutS